LFIPWAIYSYFFGENSLITYLGLRSAYVSLLKEKEYWEDQNEMLKEKLEALQKNKKFYYEKLAREMFLKGKEGEEVILFVR
jgi:cell division protein FtsB